MIYNFIAIVALLLWIIGMICNYKKLFVISIILNLTSILLWIVFAVNKIKYLMEL